MTFRSGINAEISVGSYSQIEALKLQFVKQHTKTDLLTLFDHYNIGNQSILELAMTIKSFLKEVHGRQSLMTGILNGQVVIEINDDECPLMIEISRSNGKTNEANRQQVKIGYCSVPELAISIDKFLGEKYSTIREASVSWWYNTKDGPDYITLLLNDNTTVITPELYPYLREGPEAVFNDYMKSSSPLLFLSGDPGTGKTSFLRYMLCKNLLNAYIAYDIKLLESDQMFISFFSATDTDILIFEDAEQVVIPRKSGNSLMHRFLNVTDGILKFPKKKIIFTTNESNFEKIDEALIRPGRCHNFLEFRKLTCAECEAATASVNLPYTPDGRSHSVAELFNFKNRIVTKPKVGFAA